jgi:hypothetical protein
MNPYREQVLRSVIKDAGRVTITIVGYDDMSFDETYDNFEEAIAAIEHYEQVAEVYF